MVLDPEDGDQYGYFILRPESDEFQLVGGRVTYAEALAAHSDSDTVPVVHISGIVTGSPTETSFGGVPSVLFSGYPTSGSGKIIEASVGITYDRGGTNIPTAPDGGSSVLLIELVGDQSGYTVDVSTEYSVNAWTFSEGGQLISVGGTTAPFLQDLLTDIKIWRLSGIWDPSEPPPPPPAFWTNILGSREIP